MIGIARSILDSLVLETHMKHLTHEVLLIFMTEVCAIVNSRLNVPVSSDLEKAIILTPSILLTQTDMASFE